MEMFFSRSRSCTNPMRIWLPFCSIGGLRSISRIWRSTSPESNQPCWAFKMACTWTAPEEPGVTVMPPESVTTSRSTGPETVSERSKEPSLWAAQIAAAPSASAAVRRVVFIFSLSSQYEDHARIVPTTAIERAPLRANQPSVERACQKKALKDTKKNPDLQEFLLLCGGFTPIQEEVDMFRRPAVVVVLSGLLLIFCAPTRA